MDILSKTTRLNDEDHHETGLLWRRDDVQLPNNRRDVGIRLQSLRRKFHSDPSLEEKYRVTKGYARKLSDEEASKLVPERDIYLTLQ